MAEMKTYDEMTISELNSIYTDSRINLGGLGIGINARSLFWKDRQRLAEKNAGSIQNFLSISERLGQRDELYDICQLLIRDLSSFD